jgi:hypothetical protein
VLFRSSTIGTTAGTIAEQAFLQDEKIFSTETGKKLLEKLDNKSDVMNSITSKLSNSELEKLNELLDLLRTFKEKKS